MGIYTDYRIVEMRLHRTILWPKLSGAADPIWAHFGIEAAKFNGPETPLVQGIARRAEEHTIENQIGV